jgi:hypothetical protein
MDTNRREPKTGTSTADGPAVVPQTRDYGGQAQIDADKSAKKANAIDTRNSPTQSAKEEQIHIVRE